MKFIHDNYDEGNLNEIQEAYDEIYGEKDVN
jgi:hypothetical protein